MGWQWCQITQLAFLIHCYFSWYNKSAFVLSPRRTKSFSQKSVSMCVRWGHNNHTVQPTEQVASWPSMWGDMLLLRFHFWFFFYCFCNVGKCLFNIYDITLQVFEIRLHKNIMQLMGTFSPSSPAQALHHLKHLLTCFGIRLATKTAATTMLLSFISFNKSPNHIRGLLTFQGCHSQAVKVKSQCDCEGVLIACANFPPTQNKLAHEVRWAEGHSLFCHSFH